jgi:hypothetical protein
MRDLTYPPPPRGQRSFFLVESDGEYGREPYVYSHTDREPDPRYGDLRPTYFRVFRRADTGQERRFGCEGRSTPDRYELGEVAP